MGGWEQCSKEYTARLEDTTNFGAKDSQVVNVVEHVRVCEVEARVGEREVLEITDEHIHVAITWLNVDSHGERAERFEGANLAAEPGAQAQHAPTLE